VPISMHAIIILLAFIALGCSAGAGILITYAEASRKRVDLRMAAIGSQAAMLRTPALMRRISRAASKPKTSIQRVAGLFGFDLARAKYYTVNPWIILIGSLIGAQALSWALSLALGDYSLLLLPAIWAALSNMAVAVIEGKRRALILGQFPDALAMIVRSVRVGVPVSEAVRIIAREAPAPTAAEFARVEAEVLIGMRLDESLRAMAVRTGVSEYNFFATTLSLQAQTGGALSETLEGLADVVRKRLALKAKGEAMAAQAKTSAIVLGVMPFVSGGGMYFLNPDYIEILFYDSIGKKMLGVAIAMLTTGGLVMYTMINKSLN
jgi:tight adherence protein B